MAKLPNYEYLKRGRALGWKLAPLALCKNSYSILRRYVDDAEESMSDEMKDFAVGLMMSTGAKMSYCYNVVSVPLRWNLLPKPTPQPALLSKSGGVESTVTVRDAVPLLLNQDESNNVDLDLGANIGETPPAGVTPALAPSSKSSVAQRKAIYKEKGLNIKKRVKSTVVKTTAPTATTMSTPINTQQSTVATSEKTDKPEFKGFKIPLKRRRLSSDSSDGCESTVSSMPEAPTTSKSWRYASEKRGGEFSDYQDQLKSQRRGFPARRRRSRETPERAATRDPGLEAVRRPIRDSKSVESTKPPRDIESVTRMVLKAERLVEENKRLQRRLFQTTREVEERRGRHGEHSSGRGWNSRDRHHRPGRSWYAD